MGLKDFMMRKLLESKLKDVPAAERERLMELIEKNPEFFQKIAAEVEVETKSGKGQMDAVMAVMQRHEAELRGLM